MSLPEISADEAKRLISQGASLIDVREADERARERVTGARHAPRSRLDEAELGGAGVMIFHCKSGMRTRSSAARLAAKPGDACEAYIVESGLEALRKAGLPVQRYATQSLELNRQVLIGAGLCGVATLLAAAPWSRRAGAGEGKAEASI